MKTTKTNPHGLKVGQEVFTLPSDKSLRNTTPKSFEIGYVGRVYFSLRNDGNNEYHMETLQPRKDFDGKGKCVFLSMEEIARYRRKEDLYTWLIMAFHNNFGQKLRALSLDDLEVVVKVINK